MLKYLVIIGFLLVIIPKSKNSLHMLQQNLYNENNRYLKWVFQNSKNLFDLDLIFVFISLIGFLVVFDISFISNSLLIALFILSVILSMKINNKIKNNQNKKPLVYTKRIKRLIFTTSVLYLIPIIILVFNNNFKMTWFLIFILSIMILLNNYIVFISNIINYPYERGVYYYYKHKAQSKLKSMSNLKIIGITGSYGKTSSKNILSEILNVKYNALPTPKNLNTFNGLIMTVNNYMDKFTDVTMLAVEG